MQEIKSEVVVVLGGVCDPEVLAHLISESIAQTLALEAVEKELEGIKMIVDPKQISDAAEFCSKFNPFVVKDAEFFEQKIYDIIEAYKDGQTVVSLYGFYVLFQKCEEVVYINVLVNPSLGYAANYIEATLVDGILTKGF